MEFRIHKFEADIVLSPSMGELWGDASAVMSNLFTPILIFARRGGREIHEAP